MIRRSLILLALVLAVVSCASNGRPPRARAVAIPELRGPELAMALSVAKSTGRNVLVEYTDEDCGADRRMQERTLTDPVVKERLKSVVYVRMIKGESAAEFEDRFGERGTPTFIVLKPDGTTPGSLVTGEIGTEDFRNYLAWARTARGPEPEFTPGAT